MSINLPDLNTIREAILNAPQLPDGFPFQSLRGTDKLRNTPHLQNFLNEIRREAARVVSTPVPALPFSIFRLFEETGDRSVYQNAYFDRRRRLASLTITTIIDETDDYLPALHDLIYEICNEYAWALPAHLLVGIDNIKNYSLPPEQIVDLFAAETAHALAEVLYILSDKLDDWLDYRIRHEIEKRVFEPIFTIGHRFEWETARMNWASVCGGSVGMAALLLENDRERLITMIDRMLRTMEHFLSGFGADGACPEGIGYWVYGFAYYTYFAEMLSTVSNGALDLLHNEHVKRIASFPGTVNLSDNNFINYSDASAKAIIQPGFASYLSEKLQTIIPGLDSPDFHSDHVYRWGHISRNLMWTETKYLHQPATEGTFYLDVVEWLICKHRIDGEIIAFSAKGGHNNEPHNHNDIGHFILHAGGESILSDLGAGEYTKQYFGKERYDSLFTGSQGHSVPLINGKTQNAGSAYQAIVTNSDKRENGATFELDLTRAYDINTLKSFVRSFEWQVDSTQARLTLTDIFEFDNTPSAIEEYFISLINPIIEGNTVSWRGEFATVHMIFDDRQMAAIVDTPHTKTHSSKPLTVYRLRLLPQDIALSYQIQCDFTMSFA